MIKYLFSALFLLIITESGISQQNENFTTQEVIYGHKYGMAMTMIVAEPTQKNGKGIINVISGNWISSYDKHQAYLKASEPYLNAGYTVFLTMHSSAPIFDITEAVSDIKRAVQFVRYNGEKFSIDPDNLGITGGSSGGHVALTVANADDVKNQNAEDPIERMSSKVQAVAVFYPPTDFLNFGMEGFNPVSYKHLLVKQGVLGAFQFKSFSEDKFLFEVIEDDQQILDIARSVSPAQLVTPDDPPTYIVHGDKDMVVPLQQSLLIVEKLEKENVPVVLTVKADGKHGWDNMDVERNDFVKWFDNYLIKDKITTKEIAK